jgi:hypothetical protein
MEIYIQQHTNWSRNMETAGRGSFTPLHVCQFFLETLHTKFHENPVNGLVADTRSWQTRSPHKVSFFYFANDTYKIALVLLDICVCGGGHGYYKLQVHLQQFYSFVFETAAFTFESHIHEIQNYS